MGRFVCEVFALTVLSVLERSPLILRRVVNLAAVRGVRGDSAFARDVDDPNCDEFSSGEIMKLDVVVSGDSVVILLLAEGLRRSESRHPFLLGSDSIFMKEAVDGYEKSSSSSCDANDGDPLSVVENFCLTDAKSECVFGRIDILLLTASLKRSNGGS